MNRRPAKHTLGSAIMRNLEPNARIISGSIFLDNIDIINLADTDFDREIRWKKIAMIFQGAMNTLDPVFPIGEQMQRDSEEPRRRGKFAKQNVGIFG